uniref:Putative structural protein n=1 Tax=viral metagenome TaxID=1070528 RepID=A0A6M3KF69_9ZZZZ
MATSTPITIADLNQTDNETTLNIGNLRRAYAVPFGSDRLSKLNIDADPLFHVLATKRNKPVNDTHFKIFEQRPFLYKRYAYVVGWKTWSGTGDVPVTGYTVNSADISTLTPQTVGSTFALKMGTDYNSVGNIQNVYGQATNKITIGAAGTLPIFYMENQIIKICTKSATADLVADDFITCRIKSVQTSGYYAYLGVIVVGALKTAANKYLCSFTDATTPISDTYTYSRGHDVGGTKGVLETMKTYVVGNAFKSGSGLPGSTNDQPFSTRYGLTQIQKHALAMDNSTMATELKFVSNEYQRLWSNVVATHKWDIATDLYFSDLYEEADGTRHTQGIVPWTINYGNIFSLTTSSTEDSFINDFSTLLDPRYNPIKNYLFCMDTYYWDWFHKVGGYAYNNLMLGNATATYGAVYANSLGKDSKIGGATIFQYTTYHGPVNMMRDIHLDSSPVKIIAIPMNNILYRPLVGNGINRDTTIYVGVNKIENTGVDSTTNLIQTEFGTELTLPETWAVWL